MTNSDKSQKIRFNMLGYLIELDKRSHSWTWHKWEYSNSSTGKKHVVHRKGGLEFMKMFHSLLTNNIRKPLPQIRTQQEMTRELKKHGINFIFLYQGGSVIESKFHTVEEAEACYQLNQCTSWNLTDYWFAYDRFMESWCMFDAFTGEIKFTPSQAEDLLKQDKNTKSLYKQQTVINKPANTFH